MKLEKKEAGQSLLKALLAKQVFSDEEAEIRFQQACSPGYWRKLNPQLSVCDDKPFNHFESGAISPGESDDMLKKLKRDGYLTTNVPLIGADVANRMMIGVENLRKAGWHEVWAFVYDEFWQVTRTPSLVALLKQHLGDNFKAMPHVVVHYVHPETGAGWSPHVDFSERDDRFTVWFSITDATIDNGCMYVISKHKVSDELLGKWIRMEDLNHREVKALLQGTKALPVTAGSILAWEGDVIHWGTTSSPKVQPRVSLSVVYLRENVEPLYDEVPLLSPETVPDFSKRMFAVAKAINYYNIHVLALNKFATIGKRVTARFKQEAMHDQVNQHE
jgi:hypothetical protein